MSEASDYFTTVKLKEFMCLEDYKSLTKIRVRNYVSILRMITKMDSTQETYNDVKKKLFQIKRLTQYLDLKYHEIYERLIKDEQIYDLDLKGQGDKKSESFNNSEIYNKNEKDGDNEESSQKS